MIALNCEVGLQRKLYVATRLFFRLERRPSLEYGTLLPHQYLLTSETPFR